MASGAVLLHGLRYSINFLSCYDHVYIRILFGVHEGEKNPRSTPLQALVQEVAVVTMD